MNTSWDELLSKLRADADYRKAFAAIDPGDLQPAHVLDAIAAYHRSLLTPNARFDQYLRGQRDAITDEEKRGYHLFKAYGCIACHQVNVGGNLFQKFGVFQDPLSQRRVSPRPTLDASPSPTMTRIGTSSVCRASGMLR